MYSLDEFLELAYKEGDFSYLRQDESAISELNEDLKDVPIPEGDFYKLLDISNVWVYHALRERVTPTSTDEAFFWCSGIPLRGSFQTRNLPVLSVSSGQKRAHFS
jgi:hypothetical protein